MVHADADYAISPLEMRTLAFNVSQALFEENPILPNRTVAAIAFRELRHPPLDLRLFDTDQRAHWQDQCEREARIRRRRAAVRRQNVLVAWRVSQLSTLARFLSNRHVPQHPKSWFAKQRYHVAFSSYQDGALHIHRSSTSFPEP